MKKKEIKRQKEEIKRQNEEIKRQNEDIKRQNEEIKQLGENSTRIEARLETRREILSEMEWYSKTCIILLCNSYF